ncbi:MAG: hypothetical protein JWN70_5380 [Planctomycetaceae bacterium]|nr:hypothetical protein [Planctomycetaceae bacterium]
MNSLFRRLHLRASRSMVVESRKVQIAVVVCLAMLMCATSVSAAPETEARPAGAAISIIKVASDRAYTIGVAKVGEKPYIDRQYQIRKLPESLDKQVLIRTSMDDDYAAAADHLQLQLPQSVTLSVCIDKRGRQPPGWLDGWVLAKESVEVDGVPYHIYQKTFPAGRVTLGGNDRNRTGANSNYLVIASPRVDVPVPKPDPLALKPVDFAREIQPILQDRCFSCHGSKKQEAGLRLDIRRRAYLGGDTGPAIVPGSSVTSELVRRITTDDETQRMPPDEEPLPAEQIALLRRWVDQKAPWPDALAGKESFDDHWSFRAINRPDVPQVVDSKWIRNPIDAFVMSKLDREKIIPSPEADRRTLARRLSLDLLGLPPSPADVEAFISNVSPDAYEQFVDRLLASKHFGERWGKHWLDLASFAESDGYENDRARPHAWRYRDWVIDAINRDLAFDQFTIEQIAGDMLPDARPDQRVAAGLHRNTLYNSAGGADKEEFRTKAVKERTATTGVIWMGLTLNCCECHSHKYDPIAHREYYQFYAFFNNADDANEGEAATFKPAARVTQIHKRGSFLDLGLAVEPGTPSFLPPLVARGPQADRLDLARWIVSPENPLTARVAVNHVWQHLFGQGLVPTPENYGRKGEAPAHLELLDWLASAFRDMQGISWSRKHLIRLIVTSATYRQVSVIRPELATVDPDNRLLARQNRYRVEGELVRDLSLAACGLLDPTVGGTSVQPPLPKGLGQLAELKNENFREANGNPHRRGIYVHMQRTFSFPMLAAFDAPDGNQCIVMRDRSTTPMQALTLLNEPTLDECARVLGKRLMSATQDQRGRLLLGFELCLSRPPSDAELAIMQGLVERQSQAGAKEEAVWRGVARTLINLDEFITRE